MRARFKAPVLAAAISLSLGAACSRSDPPPSSVDGSLGLESNKALVRRWIVEGFNLKDVNVVDEVFVEGFTVNGSAIGRAALKQNMSARLAAFPDLNVSILEIVAERDKVGLWYKAQGTHRGEFEGVQPTDRHVSWSGADLLRVENGRITDGWFVDDSLGLLRQLRNSSALP
jgi:predicted ester cyclase